jgi:hypothetical protein
MEETDVETKTPEVVTEAKTPEVVTETKTPEVVTETPIPQCTLIDEDTLPEQLKGKLILNTEERKLYVMCSEKQVTVDDYYTQYGGVIQRSDGNWYMCQTLNEERRIPTNVFVNLTTGEMCKTPTFGLILWRAHITYSPDYNFILLDAGIMASSARQIILIDIRDLNNYNILHREEIWYDPPTSYECSFNSKSEFVMKYTHDIYRYKNIIEYEGDDDGKLIKEAMVKDKLYDSVNDIDDKRMWKAGVQYHTCEVTVTRVPDSLKTTPYSQKKWDDAPRYSDKKLYDSKVPKYLDCDENIGEWCIAHNRTISEILSSNEAQEFNKQYETKYGTNCSVNEMSELCVEESENYQHYLDYLESCK